MNNVLCVWLDENHAAVNFYYFWEGGEGGMKTVARRSGAYYQITHRRIRQWELQATVDFQKG